MNQSIFSAAVGHDPQSHGDPMQELAALRDASLAFDAQKHDHVFAGGDLAFDADCKLTIPNILPVALSDHATQQLYKKFGPGHFGAGSTKSLPFDYLAGFPGPVRATLLGFHAKQAHNKRWLVRCYGEQGRAVLDEKYPCLPNSDLLDTIYDLLQESRPPDLRLARPYVSPDHLVLRTMYKDTGRDDGRGGHWGVGVFVANDEIGSGRIKVWPLLQQTGCSNSIIFRNLKTKTGQGVFQEFGYDEEGDQQGDFIGISLVHRGDLGRIKLYAKEAIGTALKAGAGFLAKVVEAETAALPNFNDVLAALAKENGWPEDTKLAVSAGTHGEATVLGVVNGITWAAQREEPLAAVEMEALAGGLLVDPRSLFGMAARAERERVEVVR